MQPAHEKPDPKADSPEEMKRREERNRKWFADFPIRAMPSFDAPLLKPNASLTRGSAAKENQDER